MNTEASNTPPPEIEDDDRMQTTLPCKIEEDIGKLDLYDPVVNNKKVDQHEVIYENIKENMPQWSSLINEYEDLEYIRLRGNSNAVFRINLKNHAELVKTNPDIPSALLYRRFQQQLVDRSIEQAIFKAKSNDRSGPQLYYMNKDYRFEEFFHGRPLTLWEMRNMCIQQSYAQIISNFNFNKASNEAVNQVSPLNQEYLFINTIIREQAANLKVNIKKIQEKLSQQDSEEHRKNLEIAKTLEKTFLFDGYVEHFEALIPKSTYSSLDLHNYTKASSENPFPTVLCHNDIHQNNILMKLADNRQLLIIDNEYAGWNPMAMDLAVYINETMINNTHPEGNGVKEYAENLMSEYEQEQMIKEYMRQYFINFMDANQRDENDNDEEKYVATYYDQLKRQVLDCCLLNNFFWGVWALSLLSEDQWCNKAIFNFDFASSRCTFYEIFCKKIMQTSTKQNKQEKD